MPQVIKSVLVSHSAEDMFDLVDAVEHYSAFLPWCGGARIHSRDNDHTLVTIDIRYLGVAHSFTTRNEKHRPAEMTLALVDGPFKSLGGAWHFTALTADACKVEFQLNYTFANAIIEGILGPVMSTIAETFVDRFAARADELALRRSAQFAGRSPGGSI
ncbi:MAG: type II toxin-antitoxin system RatA family toxin [Pseudomonadota bacterium]